MIDMLFKLAVVALAASFLWVYYTNAQNGRYQHTLTEGTLLAMDTREGIVFVPVIEEEMPPSND